MKKLVLIVFAIVSVMGGMAQKIKGSDTVLPLSQKEAEQFIKNSSMARVTVTGGGSGVGIAALIDGTTEIAQASRKIKMDEKMKLKEAGVSYKEVIIANDALAVVVNPKNKVSNLTREQLEGIFTGKINNWKALGGDDMKIVVYSRETSSGTYEFFKDHVMNRKNFALDVLSMPATGAIIQSVGQTAGAIGYVGLAYLHPSVKAIHVSYNKGKTYIEPSMATAVNKTYPVVRPLMYYYNSKDESKVKKYIDYVLSPEGQKIVEQVGYIPVK
ncbi:MAG: PstS family phosphate ABC transporter substrate-binding protein [Bacteroidales bacterium]|jgi:phosphate transport system substrate-binding protein|nr:PstS family phosphate ABC transporter substrate-binding protein [Bacteroidales bacterium]